MGIITRMDSQGDGTVIEWNSNDAQSVSRARKSFDSLRAAGFEMFRLTEDRERGTPLRGEFDPSVAAILAIPRMAGG